MSFRNTHVEQYASNSRQEYMVFLIPLFVLETCSILRRDRDECSVPLISLLSHATLVWNSMHLDARGKNHTARGDDKIHR
jgi:hypothetical protein